jgi:hypothetical protein
VTASMAERALAVWQSEPCPSWCEIDHRDRDFDEDRDHMGPTIAVPMRLAPAVEQGARTEPGSGDARSIDAWEVATWKLYLRQPDDGGAVRVHMYNDDKVNMQIDLVADEGQELIHALQLLLGQIETR